MNIVKIIFITSLLLLSSCNGRESNSRFEEITTTAKVGADTYVSVMHYDNEFGGQAILIGVAGNATVDGDNVRIGNNTVYLNDISYGAITSMSEVKYVVNSNGRNLYVDNVYREAVN